MKKNSVWNYYYQAKDALQMVEAFFVFGNNDEFSYMEFDKIWSAMKRIGELIAETTGGDNRET